LNFLNASNANVVAATDRLNQLRHFAWTEYTPLKLAAIGCNNRGM